MMLYVSFMVMDQHSNLKQATRLEAITAALVVMHTVQDLMTSPTAFDHITSLYLIVKNSCLKVRHGSTILLTRYAS